MMQERAVHTHNNLPVMVIRTIPLIATYRSDLITVTVFKMFEHFDWFNFHQFSLTAPLLSEWCPLAKHAARALWPCIDRVSVQVPTILPNDLALPTGCAWRGDWALADYSLSLARDPHRHKLTDNTSFRITQVYSITNCTLIVYDYILYYTSLMKYMIPKCNIKHYSKIVKHTSHVIQYNTISCVSKHVF